MKYYLLLLAVIVTLASCEHKDYADPIAGVPVFSVTGLRNGEPFTVAAGVDGLIQKTTVERNKYGVLEWTSSFVAAGSSTNSPILKLTVNDAPGMTFAEAGESEIFDAGELAFASQPSDSGFTSCHFALVNPLGGSDFQLVDFHVNDGPPVTDFPISLVPGINIVDADFSVDDNQPNGLDYTITQSILAGSHHKLSAPFRYRHEDEDGMHHLHLYFPQNLSNGLRATSWETSNGYSEESEIEIILENNSSIRLNFHNDEINLNGYYEISWDNSFNFFEHEAQDPDEDVILTAPSIQTTWETGELNYSKVFIDYFYNDKHYTSINPAQNASLTIIAIEPYTSSDGSDLNRKLKANFSITLFEVGNPQNTLELSNCSGEFGFHVPN